MTTQSTIFQPDTLEQAIQTVIRDSRVPENLRVALGVYGRQRAEQNKSEARTMRHGDTEVICLPEIIRPREADPYPCNPLSFDCEDNFLLSCESTVIEQGLRINAKYDKQSLEWSIDINGHRNERIPFEVMEILIECAVVATGISLKRKSCRRPQ